MTWSKGRQPPGAVLYSSREPSELSQWLCHDDRTINIVAGIIPIIIIIIIRVSSKVSGPVTAAPADPEWKNRQYVDSGGYDRRADVRSACWLWEREPILRIGRSWRPVRRVGQDHGG